MTRFLFALSILCASISCVSVSAYSQSSSSSSSADERRSSMMGNYFSSLGKGQSSLDRLGMMNLARCIIFTTATVLGIVPLRRLSRRFFAVMRQNGTNSLRKVAFLCRSLVSGFKTSIGFNRRNQY
jgi:hypothetical protein